jgi:hypothetical protein
MHLQILAYLRILQMQIEMKKFHICREMLAHNAFLGDNKVMKEKQQRHDGSGKPRKINQRRSLDANPSPSELRRGRLGSYALPA